MYELTRDAAGKELSRVEKSNTITKAPVTEVIARGTKPKTTVTEEVVLEEIPYTSELQNNPELLEGTTSVRTAGQAGERTIVYEVTRDAEGKELSRVEKSNTITKAPVTEVIARGTKPKTTVTDVEKSNKITKAPVTEEVVRVTKPKTTVTEEVVLEEIPYTSEFQNDP